MFWPLSSHVDPNHETQDRDGENRDQNHVDGTHSHRIGVSDAHLTGNEGRAGRSH